MKWKYYPLPDGDLKAKAHFLASFSMSAQNHRLTKLLTDRFCNAGGAMFAIAKEQLDLDKITDYQWAGTYAGGKQWYEAAGSTKSVMGERSIDGLVAFLSEFLQNS